MEEYFRFMALDVVGIKDVQRFVSVYQPNAVLRQQVGLNVRVGSYIAPPGGEKIRKQLLDMLRRAERNRESAYRIHREYETLHPFTDGNGRCGRMLWRWQMRSITLGFLHTFYYQTLEYGRTP
jgi:Fic family protein